VNIRVLYTLYQSYQLQPTPPHSKVPTSASVSVHNIA
jgi:hypothetical protein